MSFSYEEWKKKDNERRSKRPKMNIPTYDQLKARHQAERAQNQQPKERWKTIEEFRYDAQGPQSAKAQQADVDRYAKQYKPSRRDIALQHDAQGPKKEKARHADAARFAGKYLDDETGRTEQARKADSDRFSGRYTSEQFRANTEILKTPTSQIGKQLEKPTVKPNASSTSSDKNAANDRFAGRYKSEQARQDLSILKTPNSQKGKFVAPVQPKPNVQDTDSERFAGRYESEQNREDLAILKTPTSQIGKQMEHKVDKTNFTLPKFLEKGKGDIEGAKGFLFKDNVNDTNAAKAGANLRLGLGEAISDVGSGLAWLTNGDSMITRGIKKAGNAISDGFEDSARTEEFSWDALKDPEWYSTQLPRTIPQMLTSVLPGIGAAALTGKINKIKTLPKVYKAVVQAVGGGGVQAMVDSTLEAGGVYEEALRRGMTEEQANDAGNTAFSYNFGLNAGTSIGEYLLMLHPVSRKFASLNKGLQVGLRATGGAVLEAGQEGTQEAISAHALGDEFSWSDPSTIEAMVLGGILGGTVTGLGAAYTELKKSSSPVPEIIKRAADTLPEEIRAEFDEAVTTLVQDRKMSQDEAIEIVAEQLIERDPSFADVIAAHTKQYIEDKKLERQSSEKNPITQEQENMEKVQVEQEEVVPTNDTFVDVPSAPPIEPEVQAQPNTPPVQETPKQAPKEPVDVAPGDKIQLQGTRAETTYEVEAVDGDEVQVRSAQNRTFKVPASRVIAKVNPQAEVESAEFEDMDDPSIYDEMPSAQTVDDVVLPPNFRNDLHATLKEMVEDGVPINEAVEGLKADDDYYSDTPEWHKFIDEEAKAFGYKPVQQPKAEQPTTAQPTQTRSDDGELRKKYGHPYDGPKESIIKEMVTQSKLDNPVSNTIREWSKEDLSDREMLDKIFGNAETEAFFKGLLNTQYRRGGSFTDALKFADVLRNVFNGSKQEGKPEPKTESAPVKKDFGSRFEKGDTVYKATVSGTAEESIIVGKDDKQYTISPVRDKKYKWMAPFGLSEADQDIYADKTEAENAAKVKKELEDKRYHDYITGKDSGREPDKAKLITPTGKNKETGRPIYKYNLVGKKWIVVPLNAPRTVNGEPNTKKAYLHIRRGYHDLKGKVTDDMAIVDKGTIYIGADKSFVWEGKNIHDVFPDIPPYNVLNISEIKAYLEGEVVHFKDKEEEDAKLEAGKERSEQTKVRMFEEGNPMAVFSANKDEWNNQPFEATHQRYQDKARSGRHYLEEIQVLEFETPKGKFFTRRTETVPYINPAPIDVLAKLAVPLSEVPAEFDQVEMTDDNNDEARNIARGLIQSNSSISDQDIHDELMEQELTISGSEIATIRAELTNKKPATSKEKPVEEDVFKAPFNELLRITEENSKDIILKYAREHNTRTPFDFIIKLKAHDRKAAEEIEKNISNKTLEMWLSGAFPPRKRDNVAKEPYLTILFKNEPVPKVAYKETKTRITATFIPNKKHWHKEDPAEMTLVFSKDKDNYLNMPKHNGNSASVADINEWLNLNYYQEGVTAKDLIEAFDFMDKVRRESLKEENEKAFDKYFPQKDEPVYEESQDFDEVDISTGPPKKQPKAETKAEPKTIHQWNKPKPEHLAYSDDFTHFMYLRGIKVKTNIQNDLVYWMDENGNEGTDYPQSFHAVPILKGEELKKQKAKEAEIAETIKKNYSFDPFEGFPPGLKTTGLKKPNGSLSREDSYQYSLNEKTVLSLMSDEDILDYAAEHYASSTYKGDSLAKDNMELMEEWYRQKMKNYGSHNKFISVSNPYGFKNKVQITTGDGRILTATFNEMWKRFKRLLDAYKEKNNTAKGVKPPVTKDQTEKSPKPEPTNVKADDKYAKMRDRLEFADKAAAAARKRLEARRNTLYSGLPITDHVDLCIIGMTKLAHKMIDLAEFTEQMVKEFGENRRVWIPGVYAQATAMLDYDEATVTKMLQDAYNDDSMTLIDEEEKGDDQDVSDTNGTGIVPNGTTAGATQGTGEKGTSEEVSSPSGTGTNVSSERTNDRFTDGEPDSRGEQPTGSAGDTITSPSNHGNPTERVVPVDHVITQNIYEPNAKKRFANNIKALEVLKMLEAENRHGTASELETLAKYQGWGGLSDYFDRRKPEQYQELINHVDSGLIKHDEYESMRSTTLTSFYTSYEVAKQMYDVLLAAGFNGGKILESSVGTGMFLGSLPQLDGKHQFTTVEMDSLSHRITSKLYPNQKHNHLKFEHYSGTEGSFDVVIGNVPFSENKVLDKKYTNKEKGMNKDAEGNRLPKGKHDHAGRLMEYATHNTHDYFLVKNLDMLKEGGLGMLITSSSSLDSNDWRARLVREYIEEHTDHLEVIRLPNDAFKHAGTSVTTDIIFFRKKVTGSKAKPSPIINIGNIEQDGVKGRVNEYFLSNPEQITGELKQGTRWGDQLIVSMDGFDKKVKKALSRVTKVFKDKFVRGKGNDDVPVVLNDFITEDWAKKKVGVYDGAIHESQGGFFQYNYKQWQLFKVEKQDVQKLKDALNVRDSYLALIAKEENKNIPSEAMKEERQALNEAYDKFVKTHGEMNKKGVLTPFEKDVRTVALLRSLEKAVGKKWAKVELFKERQKFPEIRLEKKGDVKQALNLSLIHRGELDLNLISDLVGMDKQETIDKLEAEGHIFFDPQEQAYVTDDEYLSGNIAKKIALAKSKDLQRNVAALEKILPPQLTIEQIADGIRFGQGWIPKEVYKDFIQKTLGLRMVTITHDFKTASWGVSSKTNYSHLNDQTYAINHRYAKRGVTGIDVIEKLMNLKSPKPALDKEAIPANLEAQVREELLNVTNLVVERLQNEFKAFVIGNPQYSEQLTRLYNDTFTSVVPRTFDGERMYGTDEDPVKIPNLNPVYKLYKHQKDAAMRVLRSQNSLLAHVVGAGKTLEMQVAIMEGRRLGIIKRPMLVVPNFMIEQHAREFQHAYPNAKIKVITTGKTENDIAGIKVSRNSKWSNEQYEQEIEKNRMLRFRSLADVKYGDYDVVIMSYTSFERISLDPENEKAFMQQEMQALREYLASVESEDGKSFTVKEIEKAIEKMETRIAELSNKDKKDVGMSFEEIGIDALFVDEAHNYKNLEYHTKLGTIGGLPNSSSKRSFDMYMKTFVMNKIGGKTVFATGTPIANSMAEMYTMLRYLSPQVLEEQGLQHFDGWAQLFGTTENSVELNAAGKFVERTRFSKFTNVGELMRIFKSFADVKMSEDLPYLKRPKAERITVKTGMSDKQKTYLELMVKRALLIATGGADPAEDNLLKLTGEGKKLALDYRLFDGTTENDMHSKLNRIAQEVSEEYMATATGNKGVDPKTGEPITFDNGTQIVFMDIGVPKATDKVKEDDSDDDIDSSDASMYKNLKERLLELGVKNEHIAFIHDYNKPEQKKKLSELFNEGKIRVLIGSTGKMGVGMNLQQRLTTLHHADPTWRPADIEQREGRIIRQGNFNTDVKIKTYVTEGSFDALMWNTLENKAKFIAQVMSGGTEIRSMDEIAELIMSFSEIKAEATGNQSMVELMKTEKEIRRLTIEQRDHSKRRATASKVVEGYKEKKANLTALFNFATRMEAKAKSTRDKNFHLVLGDKTYTDRTEGATILRGKIDEINKEKRNKAYAEVIGELGGVPIIAAGVMERVFGRHEPELMQYVLMGEVQEDGTPGGYGWVPMKEFAVSEGRGSLSRLENIVIGLSSKATYVPTAKAKLDDLETAYTDSQTVLKTPFEHTGTLRKLESEVIALREQALQHELSNTFDTVFKKDGKMYVVTGINYREVPSKNKKKLKEHKPDYEIDVVYSDITDISLSSEPDVFGENNETEYEIYELGSLEVLPITTFVREFDRSNDRKGVTEGVAESRRAAAENKRQQEAAEKAKAEAAFEGDEDFEDDDDGVSSLLDLFRDGGTDHLVSPKIAKKAGDLIANALNTVLHSGYVKNPKARGTYDFNKKTGNVRKKDIRNLRVVAHELGHAFEDYVGLDQFQAFRIELENVAAKLYPNAENLKDKDRIKEGIAEIFQLYMIDPIASEQLAPDVTKFIRQFVEGDPTLKESFTEASRLIQHELDGTTINKVLGSINFADDGRITKNIGDEYSLRGGENATRREKIKGFIKEQLFELVDFTLPFKDMRKALAEQGYEGLDIVKKLATSGQSRERARHEFTNWAADKYGRKIINYTSVEELPTFLREKYDELMSNRYTGDHDYVVRFKRFNKKDTKERAALKALSSRSFQEIAVDGIMYVEQNLRKRKDIPKELQQIIDRMDSTIEGKKEKQSSYRIFSAITQAYRYKERAEILDDKGNKKFPNLPINEKDADRLIEFGREYLPKLEPLIEEYTHNLSEVLLTKAVQGGIITEKTKQAVKKGSRFYIPTYYASSNADLDGNESDRKSARQTVHGFKGQQEIVLDVLQATMNKLTETEGAVEFKTTMDILESSLKTKGMGKFGSFINPQVIPHIVSGKQIEKQLIDFVEETTGMDASDMEGSLSNAVFKIFIKADKFNSSEPILVNWKYDKDGKAKMSYMKVAPDLYNSVLSMQPLQFGLYSRIMSKSSSFFRYLALANLKYLKTAFERDLATAYLQRDTKGGMFTYIKNTLKGVALAAGMNQKVVDTYMTSGAFSSNTENVLKSFARQSMTDGLLPTEDTTLWKTKSGKLIKLINPSTYLSWGEAIFRYGEFNATVNEMLAEKGIEFDYEAFMDGSVELDSKDLATVERILLEAGYNASKVTVNFNMHGRNADVRKATNSISFLHGAVQGLYREAEEIKEHGFNKTSKRLTYRTVATLVPFTLATWAFSRAFGDDEEEIPSDMRDKNWMIWTPWGYYAFAKPFTYSIPLAYIERFLDDTLGEDGARKYYEDIMNPLKTMYHLPYMPILFNTISDLYHNETWYGGEIVPHYQEEGPDFQEFDDKTSTLAKKQAELTFKWRNKLEGVKDAKDANYDYGISPKKFDYAITSLFGKWGAGFLETFAGKPKGDTLVFGSLMTGEEEIRSRSVDKFYKKAANVDAAHDTFGVSGEPSEVTKAFRDMKDTMKDITDLQKAVHASPNLSVKQKKELTLDLVRAKRDIARYGIKVQPKDKENVAKILKMVADHQAFVDSQK